MRIIRKSPGKRTTGRAFFRSLEFWHLFFRIVLIVSLIPLAVISFYNHASADDYAFSNYPHHAWEATGSLLGFFQGCLEQLHWSYTSWQGCFTAVILGTLDPVTLGDSWYAAVAFITFGLLIVSNLVFWRTLFGRRADSQTQRRQRMLADIAACVTSLAMIQLVPRALDMFFWWDGAVNYLPFYTSMLLLSAVLIQIYREEQLSAPKLVPAAILSFLSMGGNYATALVNLLLVLSLLTMKREIEKELANAIGQHHGKTLITKDALLMNMGPNSSNEFCLHACFRSIGIINNQTDQLVMTNGCTA